MSARRKTYVVGVGMTKFEKPGRREWDYPDMGREAGEKALADAGISFEEVEAAAVGYCYGDSTCGQRAVYLLGMTGIPVYNVNNNCSTGSTALILARQLVEGGQAECAMAVGFEKMERGSLSAKFSDRTNPLDRHVTAMLKTRDMGRGPIAAQMFGNAGREHMERYGTTKEQIAKIAEKNHRHSALNPYSQFRDIYSLDQILGSKMVHEPLTKLQCCPTSEGGAAAIVCSEAFVRKHGLQGKAVEIAGMAMATDSPSAFSGSSIDNVGFDMSKRAAEQAFAQAGLTPNDVQVVELHDCFAANELITYEALGLTPVGTAGKFIDAGDNTYGGKYVVNPSGGLISKGHPLGATGLAQCSELCWQLRGMCGERQVPGVRAALQHNIGLGGAAVVAVYRLGFPSSVRPPQPGAPNPAVDEIVYEDAGASASGGGWKSDAVFEELRARVNPSLVSKVGASYKFVLTRGGDKKAVIVDLKSGSGSVSESDGQADCTITVSDDNFFGMMTGALNPQELFMGGKLKLDGPMPLAMKLGMLTAQKANL